MRKLIRCRRTQRFLAKHGTWTDDIAQALHLTQHSEAKTVVQALNLQDVELYYSFSLYSDSQWDFAIPLA